MREMKSAATAVTPSDVFNDCNGIDDDNGESSELTTTMTASPAFFDPIADAEICSTANISNGDLSGQFIVGAYGNLTAKHTFALTKLWLLLAAALGPADAPDCLVGLIREHCVFSGPSDPLSCLVDECKPEELAARMLVELGYNIAANPPDVFVLRFLRARNFEVSRAFGMLLSMLLFRLSYDALDLIRAGDRAFPPEQFLGKYFHRADKRGHPLVLNFAAQHNKSINTTNGNRKHTVFIMESIRLLLKHPVERVAVVFDLTNAGLKNLDIDSMKYLARTLQDYYPESLGSAYIVNAPFLFRGVWAAVRPFLEPAVVSKIHFISHSELDAHVDAAWLPAQLKGKATTRLEFVPATEAECDAYEARLAASDSAAILGALGSGAASVLAACARWSYCWLLTNDSATLAGETVMPKDLSAKSQPQSGEAEVAALEKERARVVAECHLPAWVKFEETQRFPTYYHRIGVLGKPGVEPDWEHLPRNKSLDA